MWSAATGPKLTTSFQPKVKLMAAMNQSNVEILFHYKMLSAVNVLCQQPVLFQPNLWLVSVYVCVSVCMHKCVCVCVCVCVCCLLYTSDAADER